jgi:hypothetical protein
MAVHIHEFAKALTSLPLSEPGSGVVGTLCVCLCLCLLDHLDLDLKAKKKAKNENEKSPLIAGCHPLP